MQTIALLRGINVGKAKRVAMADLRQLLAGLGYANVRTLLNSGNAVFDAPARRPRDAALVIERALVSELGVSARVTLIDADELAALIADNPLLARATDLSRLFAYVLTPGEQRAPLERLAAQDWGDEALALGRYAAYVWCPAGSLDSRAAAALNKLLGERCTARNWNTIGKLAEMLTAAA